MKFLKIYVMTLVPTYLFLFCGGWMLFDFTKHFFVATAACALVLAVLISALVALNNQLRQLRKRVESLEAEENSEQ
ncbi:MAG: hypothetical protein Q4F17_02290 [Eubacteriales bacterium]|nr:hypothetical protein [Eubacteriales bacterium]